MPKQPTIVVMIVPTWLKLLQGWLWQSESGQAINRQWFNGGLARCDIQKQYQHSEFIFCSFCALAHKEQTSLLVALLGFVVLNEAYTMYETNLSLVGKNKVQQISFQLASWNRKDAGSNASAELAYAKHFIFDHVIKINILICII